MRVELIDITTEDGVVLNGFLTQNDSKKVIIATNGMGSNCFKYREKVIAQEASKIKIDFLGYNNRGSELVKSIKKIDADGNVQRVLAGTTFEDVLEGYYDIKGSIQKAIELGYTDIYLQGHSLGSTKIVYTYSRLKQENSELLPYVKGIILLSLIDLPKALQVFLGEHYQTYLKLAEEKETKGEVEELMPKESFIHPISVKTYLRYIKYNEAINFARYSELDDAFEVLNRIDIPLLMRWGNKNEMIEQDAEDLVTFMRQKINNSQKDINYIDEADHGYTAKEEELAHQIINFISNIV